MIKSEILITVGMGWPVSSRPLYIMLVLPH